MKHVPRVASIFVFTTFALFGLACGSSAKREAARPDAQAAVDVPGLDTPGISPDTATPLPDAGARDVAATKDAAGTIDTTVPGSDTSPPKADTARPDRLEADTSPASADATPAKTDTVPLDTIPASADARAPDTVFHCPPDAGPATLTRLSPLELKTLLDGTEDPFLINVKGANIGKIPGTDAVLVNDIPGIEALVGGDLCANIILYCQSGNTSQTVATQLIAKGYRRIRDLTGGITAWKAAGYPTLQ